MTELDATLTHAQSTIHVEKEPNVKIPEDDQYVHALQDMQAIHTLDVFEVTVPPGLKIIIHYGKLSTKVL